MKKKSSIKYCLFIGLTFLSRCTNDNISDLKPAVNNICSLKDSTISFSTHILPVFTSKCALPNCHSGNSPQSNLNLEAAVAFSQINKKGAGYIDTNVPRNGVLFSTMLSTSNPMPPNGKLDNCTLELIENWMKQGGRNN